MRAWTAWSASPPQAAKCEFNLCLMNAHLYSSPLIAPGGKPIATSHISRVSPFSVHPFFCASWKPPPIHFDEVFRGQLELPRIPQNNSFEHRPPPTILPQDQLAVLQDLSKPLSEVCLCLLCFHRSVLVYWQNFDDACMSVIFRRKCRA
jgi:hypothetical protein